MLGCAIINDAETLTDSWPDENPPETLNVILSSPRITVIGTIPRQS